MGFAALYKKIFRNQEVTLLQSLVELGCAEDGAAAEGGVGYIVNQMETKGGFR
jgi:hypothetical protein